MSDSSLPDTDGSVYDNNEGTISPFFVHISTKIYQDHHLELENITSAVQKLNIYSRGKLKIYYYRFLSVKSSNYRF